MGDDTDLETRVGQLEAKMTEREAAEIEAGENHDSASVRRRGTLEIGGLIGASGPLGVGATSATAASGSVGTDATVDTFGQ